MGKKDSESLPFYPTTLKGCQGLIFTHGVQMDLAGWLAGGRAVGWLEKFVRAISQKP